MTTLPIIVMAKDPATAITMRTRGVRDRQTSTIRVVTHAAMMVMPSGPPRWVNHVRTWSLVAVRNPMAVSSVGLSKAATPSRSATAS